MTLERIYPIFNGSKVTYKEKRSFKFLPELSKGRQNDQVTIPNIPLLAAAAVNKQATFLTRVGLSGLLNSLNAQPFITLAAHRAIVGYNDNLYTLSKSYMKLQNKKVRDSIGLFANSIGERDEWITVNTGANDINKVGLYDNFDGQKSMQQWSTEECDDFSDATDGYLFPPKLVRNKRPLKYFTKDICRAFPFYFEKEVRILNGKIPAYRYALAEDVFDHPDKTPSNQCYCDLDLGECPLQGLFNATPCANGAPIFMSFPHFYKADPVLKNGVTGLKPNPEYRTYIDLHPTLGYTMGCKNRFQINVQVNKAFGISQVNMFEDNMMLPFAWFEYSVEDKTLPEDMVGIIFQTTFTLRSVELGLKYGCLLTMGVTLFGIFMVLRNRWTSRVRTSSVRPLHNDP